MDPMSEILRIKVEGSVACFQITDAQYIIKVVSEISEGITVERQVHSEKIRRSDMELSDQSLIVEADFSTGFVNYNPGLTESGKFMVATFLSKSQSVVKTSPT